MLISILLLIFGFEATNHDQNHVVACCTILCYQLSQNRVKEEMDALKNDKEDSDKDEMLVMHVLTKEKITPDNEVISDDEKIVIKIEPKDEKITPINEIIIVDEKRLLK